MSPVISVNNISKSFKRWNNSPSKEFKSVLINMAKLKNPFSEKPERDIVLENISFDIFSGEFVGIMGRNGIGKSTILKLISGIYSCSSGSIKTKGIIAPLLELGAGFEMDLSGYENIFLNASIIGYNRSKIVDKIDEIIEFSGLGDKIHRPVRNYSSGMLVRLGFSIASHLDAPILILDEVLGVGDINFVAKCVERVHYLHKKGTTIVLVSHSPDQIKEHCTRCIVLEKGRVLFDGEASQGADKYIELMV